MKTNGQDIQRVRCLIIDDDPFIRDLLYDKINQFFDEINVIGFAENGHDGLEKINLLNPELVFLDVEMTDMTGFEMLGKLPSISFKTIFITSYKHYAIKAIRFNALDYLLKPFDLEELRTALDRYKKTRMSSNIQVALNNIKNRDSYSQTLTLNTQQGEIQLRLNNIIQIKGDRNYSIIHLTTNKSEMVSKTLSHLEEILEDKGFFRCHKSHLVNQAHIAKTKYLSLVLSNNEEVPISRRKRPAFITWSESFQHIKS